MAVPAGGQGCRLAGMSISSVAADGMSRARPPPGREAPAAGPSGSHTWECHAHLLTLKGGGLSLCMSRSAELTRRCVLGSMCGSSARPRALAAAAS